MSSSVTATGQPVVLPRGNVQVIASTYDIAPGAVLPVHKHPFPRYAYVLAGTLQVIYDEAGKTETYKQGDFILEAVGQWHHAINAGPEAVKLMVIDMVEKGKPNVILQK
jgi:quercetin dioxygenase-like cupin family protein